MNVSENICKSRMWAEKFRPGEVNDLISASHVVKLLNSYLHSKKFPNLLLYGPSGTGKTSSIFAFAKKLYANYVNMMIIEINASEERGVGIVRDEIKKFVSSQNPYGCYLKKLVVLDEVDAMTPEAQTILRRFMEDYHHVVRFCLICNYKNKISEAVQSVCLPITFHPLNDEAAKEKVLEVAEVENITFDDYSLEILQHLSQGDMRKLLNMLQSISLVDNFITVDLIKTCFALPDANLLSSIYDQLKSFRNNRKIKFIDIYQSILSKVEKSIESCNVLVGYVANSLYEDLISNNISDKTYSQIIIKLKHIEINLTDSTSPEIQLSALVGIFFGEFH